MGWELVVVELLGEGVWLYVVVLGGRCLVVALGVVGV